MITARQQKIKASLRSNTGCIKTGMKDLYRMLDSFSYTEEELDLIEKNLYGTKNGKEILRRDKEAKKENCY